MAMVLDEELSTSTDRDAYEALVARLSRQSVEKHYSPYEDIDWDDPAFAIDARDPRWELHAEDGLGSTEWYRSQPPEVRSQIGLHRVVTAMKLGLQFENVLKRGLLEYAFTLPNGAPEFRYAYHEVVEETNHGMMFQEFVNRSGIDVRGMAWQDKFGSRRVVQFGRRFPALFFVFVLGGEDPIDYVQRRELRRGDAHPLLERIMRIHVTEEARHLSFARHYMKHTVPTLSWPRRRALAVATPLLLGEMATQMLQPSPEMVRAYGIPRGVLRQQRRSPANQQFVKDSVAKVRRLCVELGLVTPVSKRLWQARNIWDDPGTGGAG
jgi:hypothetical protein